MVTCTNNNGDVLERCEQHAAFNQIRHYNILVIITSHIITKVYDNMVTRWSNASNVQHKDFEIYAHTDNARHVCTWLYACQCTCPSHVCL